MEGGVIDGGPSQAASEVNTERTYAEILRFKEAQLARDALAERRAVRLTRRFLRDREECEQEKLRRLAEVSQQKYEETIRKAKEETEGRALMAEMIREEKNQILQLMKDQETQRKVQELEDEAVRAERDKWALARQCWEQLEGEKRQKVREDQLRQRVEKWEKKWEVHEQAHKDHADEMAEKKKTAIEKLSADREKVLENQRKERSERRKERIELGKRLRERQGIAEKHREEVVHNVGEKLRAEQIRARKQREALQQMQAEAEEEKLKRWEAKLEKSEKLQSFRMDRERRVQEDQCRQMQQRGQGDLTARSVTTEPGATPKGTDAKQAEEQRSVSRCFPPTFWSKELTDANNRVKKEYVQKCAELKHVGERMLQQKKFKGPADEAAKKDGEDDKQTRQLRWIHNRYIAQRSREPKVTEPPSPKSDGGGSTKEKRVKKMQPCGLCEREFPTDVMVGSAMARTVDKLRNRRTGRTLSPRGLDMLGNGGGSLSARNPDRAGSVTGSFSARGVDRVGSARRVGSERSGEQPNATASADKDQPAQAGDPDGRSGGKTPAPLYDYRVPLCSACHQYMSIML